MKANKEKRDKATKERQGKAPAPKRAQRLSLLPRRHLGRRVRVRGERTPGMKVSSKRPRWGYGRGLSGRRTVMARAK